MLGEIRKEEKRKVYLNIKDGAVVLRTATGENQYAYVEGRLESITTKERNFRGEMVVYWYIDLRDIDTGDLYSLGFPYANNVFKSIILSLSSDETLSKDSMVRIEPYAKNGFDKVVVWSDGVKLDWVDTALPPIQEVFVGGRKVKDDSKRMEYISSLCTEISNKLKKQH